MRVFNPHLRRHIEEILFIRTFKTAINEFVVMFPGIMSFKIAIDLSKSLNYLLSRRGVKASVPDSNSGDPRSIRGRRCQV